MDELKVLVFGICGALLAIEVLSGLFPDKSGELIRALAVLFVLAVLLSGITKMELDIDFDSNRSVEIETETFEDLAAESGLLLLRERLHALLEAAGIETLNGADGIEVRYRQDDAGTITIDRVCVRVRYGTDTERVFALLRSVLTEAIPVEVYTE